MRIFISFILLLFINSISSQDMIDKLECEIFRKGKFEMTGPSGGDIKIKRKNKYQFERYNRERQKYKFFIEWTSPCTYTLTLQKVKGKNSAKRFEGAVVYVEIVAITNDSYTAKSRTQDGTITLIEIEKAY
jgi:hypothetical protein